MLGVRLVRVRLGVRVRVRVSLEFNLTPTLVEACKHTIVNSWERVRVRAFILCSVVSYFLPRL